MTLITALAKFRVMTVSQLSAISQRSLQVIRRRKRSLADKGIVSTQEQSYGNRRGRPEELLFLTEIGWDILLDKSSRSKTIYSSTVRILNSVFIEHKLLENWFFIHLIQIKREKPNLSVNYKTFDAAKINYNSSSKNRDNKSIPIKKPDNNGSGFFPDGVFAISNSDSNKSLLFFLEVDMGTETAASPKKNTKDIRQKIVNYQNLFRSGEYKKYQKILKNRFNGFRLLFICNTNSRLKSLCRLVNSMPPSDFVWLTNSDLMFSNGLAETIWTRGGHIEKPLQSILGPSLSCKATLLDKIR